MTDGRGRRNRLVLGQGRALAQRVGEPNVLSNAARPNLLSSEVRSVTGALPGSRGWTGQTAPPVQRRSNAMATTPIAVPTQRAGQARRRTGLLSLQTVIFFGFVIFTAFRFLGQMGGGSAEPAFTTPANGPGDTPAAVTPGSITFGTASDGKCGVTGAATLFAEGTDVWWSAQLSTLQKPDATAVVVVLRNLREISREKVPADPTLGTWDVLCSSSPVEQHIGGSYVVEVWNGDESDLLASGEYSLTGE